MQNFKKMVTIGLLCFVSLAHSAPPAAKPANKTNSTNAAKEAQGIAAATEWLKLVDAKKYHDSWMSSASCFKSKVNSNDWANTVGGVRGPLGSVLSRKVKAKIYTTTLPDAPAGEYVVIEFATDFQNRKNVTETVTPMLEDSKWKVSGYFAK